MPCEQKSSYVKASETSIKGNQCKDDFCSKFMHHLTENPSKVKWKLFNYLTVSFMVELLQTFKELYAGDVFRDDKF